ncbi:adenosylcobinamide-GDP ribazoletransferase [Immundisolibacter sp.]|jgi:adenosylcobinamide-GDP ribazoletransferase|uniref:adenosylcobinamide-GDP ribazoletransferase n=1 Tax=Immundisolibacter sp. TaxID=1934948 RepID=UPI0026188296|nr:adenosylcobinamide-GDP ribazoletransferase [Immundisolibacter sp.]MDD3652522.1 adenosylcobinamide-GDP ribazoletransferase [Immundisolibacter sp.]
MRYQLELFFTALGFFTRLPVPAWVPWSPERLNHAARFFPLVGWVVGAVGAASYAVFALVLPASLAVILSMAVTIRLTGAFHEDGFADSCDGLGGGWDKAQVLAIMKDSRIGSYGTIGMVLMLMAKAAALIELTRLGATAPQGTAAGVAAALLVAHPLSRLAATSLIHLLPYVRQDDSAKSRQLARRLTPMELAIAGTCGLLPLALLAPAEALGALVAVVAVTVWAARLFVRRLGGYTGDLLGATQQLAELAAYLGLLAAPRLAALAAA